jgi:hypothetical protein
VRAVTSIAADAERAVDDIAEALTGAEVGFLLVFASPRYDTARMAQALALRFPGLPHAGGSTAGEIGPDGFGEQSLVAIAFPREQFTVAAAVLPDIGEMSFERADHLVQGLRATLRASGGTLQDDRLFAMTLLDGMSRREEHVLAMLQSALAHVPLAGGSCGDDLAFERTYVFQNGAVATGSGLLLLVHTQHRFVAFKADHFDPTAVKLVVTDCDPETRIVRELNAEPAGAVYADIAGVEPGSLSAQSFAAHPLLVKVGHDYYCRSIQKLNPDGSLTFYCAIDNGIVLTLARPRDMVEALDTKLSEVDREMGGLDFVIGFDCVLRRLDAQNRQIQRQVSDVYRRWRVVGFNTYGEQFQAMHLNQTFTGIAIGARLAS